MTKKSGILARRGAGFTLIETVVTVGLIAVLAAFVIPTVIQKAGAGDPVKVQNDLNTIRTAIETFSTDTKAGFPQLLATLTAAPTAGTTRLIDSTTMTTGQVSVWNGPYMGATITTTIKDSIATGYTAYILNYLERYDVANNVAAHDTLGAAQPTFSSAGTVFAAIRVDGLTFVQAKTVNALFDGNNDPMQADSSNVTGRFRFLKPAGSGAHKGEVLAYFLASPITK